MKLKQRSRRDAKSLSNLKYLADAGINDPPFHSADLA